MSKAATICTICGEGHTVTNQHGTHAKCARRLKWAESVLPDDCDPMAEAEEIERDNRDGHEHALANGWTDEPFSRPPLTPERATVMAAVNRFCSYMDGAEQRRFRHDKGIQRMGQSRPLSELFNRFCG